MQKLLPFFVCLPEQSRRRNEIIMQHDEKLDILKVKAHMHTQPARPEKHKPPDEKREQRAECNFRLRCETMKMSAPSSGDPKKKRRRGSGMRSMRIYALRVCITFRLFHGRLRSARPYIQSLANNLLLAAQMIPPPIIIYRPLAVPPTVRAMSVASFSLAREEKN